MVAGSAKARTHIRKAIFGNYDKVNIPDKPNVKFGLTLVNIDVVSTATQELLFYLFILLKYTLCYLRMRKDKHLKQTFGCEW